MNLDLLKKFCELRSVEATAKYFGLSTDTFFDKLEAICKELEKKESLLGKKNCFESNSILTVFIDGASSNNPGPAGIGIVFLQNEQIIDTISEYIGKKTNNEAEYIALIKALQIALLRDIKSIKVFSDSELVVNQIKCIYKVRHEHLKKLYDEALFLIKKFERFEINHILRNSNTYADHLAKSAIEHSGKQAHK